MPDEDVPLGELGRNVASLDRRIEDLSKDVVAIKTSPAGQAVKVGVVWAGLGVGSGRVPHRPDRPRHPTLRRIL